MSSFISDERKCRYKNSENRLREIPTDACDTPTKLSKPVYSYIKGFPLENGNNTYVTDANEMMMHSGGTSSHKCSMDYSAEDVTELDRVIELLANASKRNLCFYDSSEMLLNSSTESEIFSNISWLDPKSSSEKLLSHERVKYCSKHQTDSDTLKKLNGDLVKDDETWITIHETPKRTNLKPFERGIKVRQKPLRLANLPRKIYTRDRGEIRIAKEDIEIVEPNSDNKLFDIKNHLAKARRRLTFPLEDPFKTSSSSFTSIKPLENSEEESLTSITSSKHSDKKSSNSTALQEDFDKNICGFITSSKQQEDFTIRSDLHEDSDFEKQTVSIDDEYFRQNAKVLEEPDGKFLLEDYLAKLKVTAEKPASSKRAKEFEQRTTPRTYFDFDDYCKKIFHLKEKFIDSKNKSKTV